MDQISQLQPAGASPASATTKQNPSFDILFLDRAYFDLEKVALRYVDANGDKPRIEVFIKRANGRAVFGNPQERFKDRVNNLFNLPGFIQSSKKVGNPIRPYTYLRTAIGRGTWMPIELLFAAHTHYPRQAMMSRYKDSSYAPVMIGTALKNGDLYALAQKVRAFRKQVFETKTKAAFEPYFMGLGSESAVMADIIQCAFSASHDETIWLRYRTDRSNRFGIKFGNRSSAAFKQRGW